MTSAAAPPRTLPMLAGYVSLWLVLDQSARLLGSTRGEYGLVVAILVIATAIGVECLLSRTKPLKALRALGLGMRSVRGLLPAFGLSAALLQFYPIYGAATGTPLSLRADWPLLLPGLFAQGGVAEELIFRGYLFRHARETRDFWPAARWSSLPFVLAHLPLYLTSDPVVATAAVALALSISFPLAYLFELRGNSIWPAAIAHFVIQGSIKLVEAPAPQFPGMAVAWIVLSGVLPWLLFLVPPRRPA